MGKCCCAVGCSNRFFKGCGLQFYRFPTNPIRRNSWVAAVNRKDWQPTEYTWICSNHFVGGKKNDDPASPAYIPTLFEHTKSPAKRKAVCQLARYEHKKRRLEARLEAEREEAATALLQLGTTESVCGTTERDLEDFLPVQRPDQCSDLPPQQPGISVMTDLTMQSIDRLEMECSALRQENLKLKMKIKSLREPETFLDDNKKVRYFTGLPSFQTLTAIYDFVSPYVPNSRSTVPAFQQFVMVLMKLRLNADNELLASLFNVHATTVSRYFQKWIDVLYERLKPLVKWPEHEQLYETMPREFKKNFSKCIVIIDCFEVFMDRPKGLMARAQTWSNYKHHNTVKFLIGISPQGSITFISKGWGGRVSDRHLTEHCGILDHLLPGDLILADRGFNMREAAGLYCAEVKLPPFTKGKKQLTKCEVDKARQLSRVRIHVERVIGLLRLKYKILRSILPINLIMCKAGEEYSTIDKIVTICSALCNCCDSVVPFD